MTLGSRTLVACALSFSVLLGCVAEQVSPHLLTRAEKLADEAGDIRGEPGDVGPAPTGDEGSDAPTPSPTPPPPSSGGEATPGTKEPEGGDACGGLDFQGECDGDTARWCDEGELRTADCSSRGGCRWIDGEVGYYCADGGSGGGGSCGGGSGGGGSCGGGGGDWSDSSGGSCGSGGGGGGSCG